MHIIPSLAKGGAERLVLDICNSLNTRDDCTIKLVTLNDINEYIFLSKNIDIVNCKSQFKLSFFGKHSINIDNFIKIVNNFKPDIIHSHLYEAELVSREHIFKSIAYITHLHDNIKELAPASTKLLTSKTIFTRFYEKQRLLKKYISCNNNFIAISEDVKKYAFNALPKKLHNIFLLHNAIDFKRFNRNISEKINSFNELRLVTIGSLVDKKNQIFLVNSCKILKNYGINFKLNILGDGPNYEIIKNRIIELDLTDNIFLQGKVNNVEDYLFNSDFYVHSAIYEPFGLVLIEAMATGLPCITLDGKGNRDIIINDFNGFLLNNNIDYKSFAEKILYYWQNRESYKIMSKNAIIFAKKYNINIYCDNLMKIYKKILKFRTPDLLLTINILQIGFSQAQLS